MSTEHRDGPPPGAPLDIDEIADLLRITPRTVSRLVKGGMPHLRVGLKLRFIPADVLAWCSVPASGEPVRLDSRHKSHCKRGHAFDPANTIHHAGRRICRICRNESNRVSNAKRNRKAA